MVNQQLSLKTIPGVDGYSASSSGRIYSYKTNKWITQRMNKHGYKIVTLSVNGKPKQFPVHRLVALAFHSNPLNYPCVHHKDDCKTNNHADNLEWCTYTHNNRQDRILKGDRRSENKWNTGFLDKFRSLVLELKEQGLSDRQVSKIVGISNKSVGKIVKESSTTIEKFKSRTLEPEQVIDIYTKLQSGLETQSSLAQQYGVSQNTISLIKRGKRYFEITQGLKLSRVGSSASEAQGIER